MKKILPIFLCFTVITFVSCKNKNSVSQTTNTLSHTQDNSPKTEYPKSIVALSPASVEILYAIGAGSQIAAVSEFSDYPEAAKTKPIVGGFDGNTLSIEKILSFEPDFVYLTEGMHNFLIEPLNKYKIPYYVSNPNTVRDIETEILEIGTITGHNEHAKAVIKKMEDDLASIPAKSRNPGIYYEIWNSPYMSIGANSFINDVIKLAGGINIFEDISEAYPIVSEESIISRDPEVILIPLSSGITIQDIENRNGWKNTTAVKYSLDFIVDDNILSRPTPRITTYIIYLSKIFPEVEPSKWGL